MELELNEIALNRSRNHSEDKETDKGVQVRIFYWQSVRIFKLKKDTFFPYKSL